MVVGTALLVAVACNSPTEDSGDPVPPSVAPIADQSTRAGTPVDVPVTIDDAGNPVSLTAEAANEVLVQPSGLAFAGSGAARTLTVTPTPGLSGATTVTVTASSAGGAGSATFALAVLREPSSEETFVWSQRLAPPVGDSVDGFGWMVDASDDLIAVGTSDVRELNAVYLFRAPGLEGPWEPTARIAEVDAIGSLVPALGTYTVAVSDLTGATTYSRSTVSAVLWPVGGLFQDRVLDLTADRLVAEDRFSERASVYRFGGGVWSLEDALDPGPTDPNSDFASAAAIDGDVAVVGAPARDGVGAAFVFRRAGTQWVLEQTLSADDGAADDAFGAAVAVDGNLILVGAPDADNGGARSGAAYVFEDRGGWIQVAKLFERDGSNGFGASVAAHAGELVVGAPGAVDASGNGVGYHYVGAGPSWTRRLLVVPGSDAEDGVGTSVAFDVDVVVLGAPGDDRRATGSGAAHVFVRD